MFHASRTASTQAATSTYFKPGGMSSSSTAVKMKSSTACARWRWSALDCCIARCHGATKCLLNVLVLQKFCILTHCHRGAALEPSRNTCELGQVDLKFSHLQQLESDELASIYKINAPMSDSQSEKQFTSSDDPMRSLPLAAALEPANGSASLLPPVVDIGSA